MGGLDTPYGKIKSGKIFRTAAIVPKCEADKEFVCKMKLDAVVDLRASKEVNGAPDVLPDGVEYIRAAIFEDAPDIAQNSILKITDEEIASAKKFVDDLYARIVYSKEYDKIFALMDEGKTFAFHCTAGKDRTGMGAMLIELAFGRTFDECKVGYLASNDFYKKSNKKLALALRFMGASKKIRDFVIELLSVHERLFEIAKKSIFDKYSTVQEFLEKEHGITPARVQQWASAYIE